MTRETLADVLEEIALLLELKGENPFKIRASRHGAEIVSGYDGDIVTLARDNHLEGIKGLGEALRDKLHELASTGKLEFHEKLRAEFPSGLFELFEVQGLGPKKIKALHETLGVGSIADLRAACEAGQVAALPGFGAKGSCWARAQRGAARTAGAASAAWSRVRRFIVWPPCGGTASMLPDPRRSIRHQAPRNPAGTRQVQ